MKLGLQTYSIREALKEDFYGTLKKVAAIGYRNLEFANHRADEHYGVGFDASPAEMRTFLADHGLSVIGSHMGPLHKDNIRQVIEYHKALGNPAIGLGIAFWPDRTAVESFADQLNYLGRIAYEEGMAFYYHNHFMEFQKFDDKSVFEYLLDLTDQRYVSFELDLYWTQRGGIQKPETFLQTLGNRCKMIHQKDIPVDLKQINIFDSIEGNENISEKTFNGYFSTADFIEAGSGIMDIPSIIGEARKQKVEYLIVEQDFSLFSELESIAVSYEYLSNLLATR